MPRERDPNHVPIVPVKVRTAIRFLIENRDDLHAAALHAQIHISELRRSLSKTHVLSYMRAEKKQALEVLCAATPAHLADVLRGDNQMARVAAVKTAEALRLDAVELEQRAVQRAPGLQIVVIQSDGRHEVAYTPAQLIEAEVTPPEAVPVPEVVPVSPDE